MARGFGERLENGSSSSFRRRRFSVHCSIPVELFTRQNWRVGFPDFSFKPFGIATFLVVCAATALAQDPVTEIASPPPSYNVLRFWENYSYLGNPAKRSDTFDSVKCIPLGVDDPAWYLTLGGELRERFEAAQNPSFGIAGDHDAYWLQRVTLLADHASWRTTSCDCLPRAFPGLEEGETSPPPPVQKDVIDLQWAFAGEVTPLPKRRRTIQPASGPGFGDEPGLRETGSAARRSCRIFPSKFRRLRVALQCALVACDWFPHAPRQ